MNPIAAPPGSDPIDYSQWKGKSTRDLQNMGVIGGFGQLPVGWDWNAAKAAGIGDTPTEIYGAGPTPPPQPNPLARPANPVITPPPATTPAVTTPAFNPVARNPENPNTVQKSAYADPAATYAAAQTGYATPATTSTTPQTVDQQALQDTQSIAQQRVGNALMSRYRPRIWS